MNTLGWVLILTAVLVMRAVQKGRVLNIGEDLADGFLAVINGKTDDFAEVLARKGDSITPSNFDVAAANLGSVGPGLAGAIGGLAAQGGEKLDELQKVLNNNLALRTIELGRKARGYRLTATGPDYYDCSGLIWRASQKIGYKGPRFTTSTVLLMKGFRKLNGTNTLENVGNSSNATIGDIVLWPGHHMGVMTGPNQMYSARNPRAGIGYTPIKGFRKENPIYVRYTGS